MVKQKKLVPLNEDHLELVLTWRNKPEVRKNMYTNHEISKEEHLSWFKSLSNNATKRYFVFELNGTPCGVIGFTDINTNAKNASWAFYSGNTSTRGIGSMMEIAALEYAFDALDLNKLYCEVLEFNEPVIKFHKKHGFKVEGIFKKQHFADNKLWDIYRLAIFKTDWKRDRLLKPINEISSTNIPRGRT